MKRLFFLALFSISCHQLFAQSDTSTVEQYIVLTSRQPLMNLKKISFELDYGDFLKPDTAITNFKNNTNLKSLSDVLNFLAYNGWTLKTTYSLLTTDANSYHYILYKKMKK